MLFPFLLRHLAGPSAEMEEMYASTLGVGHGRTAELPARSEGKGLVGLGRGVGTPFKMVWVLPTPAKEP